LRKKLYELPSLTVGVLLAYVVGAYAVPGAQLTGIIKDEAHARIPGVSVTLLSPERAFQAESDAAGAFEFNDVPPARYEMRIKAPGFVKQTRQIEITSDSTATRVSVVLKVGDMPDMETCGSHSTLKYQAPDPAAPRVEGIVHDFYDDKPVANARVTISASEENRTVIETKSDRAGRFTIRDLPAGSYDIRIRPKGYLPLEIKQILLPRENGVLIEATVLPSDHILVCQ
jgi:carbon monoxide dehydrogenase subunit G